jgi:hypothetical protein
MIESTTTQTSKNCYLTAPSGVSIATIAQLLQERMITLITADTLLTDNPNPLDQKAAAIAADLLIAIVGNYGTNRDIFFELGYAHALKKKILIIVPSDTEELPGSLAGLPQVMSAPEDAEAIGFALDQLLAAPKQNNYLRGVGTISHPITHDLAAQVLAEIDTAVAEDHLAALIATAIRASGISIVEESGISQLGRGRDLGIWVDELDSAVGNPLLIEIKWHLRDRAAAMQARQQIEHYLHTTSTRTALLLYRSAPDELRDFVALSSAAVLFLPIHEFVTQLQTTGFVTLIRTLRNQVLHRVAA